MLKMAVLLLILLVVVLVCFRCWQHVSARGRSKSSAAIKAEKPGFSAVKVEVDLVCCQAAKEISSEIYLANKAPRLPLPECDAASCHCRYAFLADRREGERRSPVLALQERFTKPEQWANRGVRGRRKDDLDEAKRSEQTLKAALNQP